MKSCSPALKTALTFSLLVVYLLFTTSASAACFDYKPNTTPTIDFKVNNDGTVTHNKTGLMWKVCSEGQNWNAGDGSCSGTVSKHTWKQALQIPVTLNVRGGYAGHNDWRLPNLIELKSIVERKCYSPAINVTIFNNTPSSRFWSSSPIKKNSILVWTVEFEYGHPFDFYSFQDTDVRLVRSGQ